MQGLPEATSAEVIKAAKDCPVLRTRRVKVTGSVDVNLFNGPPPPSGPGTNVVMRLPNPLGRPIEGLIVTRQNVAGSVVTLRPDDPDYTTFFSAHGVPPEDPVREIIVKASVVGMIVRLLAY